MAFATQTQGFDRPMMAPPQMVRGEAWGATRYPVTFTDQHGNEWEYERLGGGLSKLIKRATKAVMAPVKAVAKVATKMTGDKTVFGKVAGVAAKVATAPLKATTMVGSKLNLPGMTKAGRLVDKATGTIAATPGRIVRGAAAGAVAVVASSSVLQSKESRDYLFRGGGFETALRTQVLPKDTGKVALKVAPYVGSVLSVIPGVGTLVAVGVTLAINAALAARNVMLAKKANKKAQADFDAAAAKAYADYLAACKEGGATPVSQGAFSDWLVAGAQGDIPLGAPSTSTSYTNTESSSSGGSYYSEAGPEAGAETTKAQGANEPNMIAAVAIMAAPFLLA